MAVEHHHVLAVPHCLRTTTIRSTAFLVAQAVAEGAALMTVDRSFRPYEVDIVWGAGRDR